MNTRFAPAVRFGCKMYLKGAALFVAIMLLLNVFFAVISAGVGGESTVIFSGWAMISVFFLFVVSIAGFRENQRVFVQNGVSRSTGFWAELTALAITAAALSLFGEVFIGTLQTLTQGSGQLFAADLYQMMYQGFDGVRTLTLGQHVVSGLLNFCLLLFAALFGQWYSALFWRLNKFWTVVVAISIVVGFNAGSWGLHRLYENVLAVTKAGETLVAFVASSPWNAMLLLLLIAAFFGGFNWLLFRNTYLKAAK